MTPIAVTFPEAGEFLRVSVATIKREVHAGRLPVFHIGNAARIRVEALREYAMGREGEENRRPRVGLATPRGRQAVEA